MPQIDDSNSMNPVVKKKGLSIIRISEGLLVVNSFFLGVGGHCESLAISSLVFVFLGVISLITAFGLYFRKEWARIIAIVILSLTFLLPVIISLMIIFLHPDLYTQLMKEMFWYKVYIIINSFCAFCLFIAIMLLSRNVRSQFEQNAA